MMREGLSNLLVEYLTWPDAVKAADAIIAALPGMVQSLKWERVGETYHWVCDNNISGKPSFIKVYAGTDCYNLYADGFRGTGNNFGTLEAAIAAAEAHHVAQAVAPFGIEVTT